ncbi:MAG: PhnA domain-containing protein [Crocinitomicaceae bacterium]|nr:PhnA domain-containing protein [Crocinitomicaceae bacterium]
MSINNLLNQRSADQCELCSGTEGLDVMIVSPQNGTSVDHCINSCHTCRTQINDSEEINFNHWRCLNESMWSEVPAVQVVAWRMLNRIKEEGWPQDLLDMLFLEEQTLNWAKSGDGEEHSAVIHKDSNGVTLIQGDSVVLIKDLKVKGAGFTAKRGTAVRNITLVHDNPDHIEGKVNGQKIVILTQYVKK